MAQNPRHTFSRQIKASVIGSYVKAAGWGYPLLLAVSFLMFVLVQCATQLWLSEWSRDQPVNGTADRDLTNLRVGVFGGLAAVQSKQCFLLATPC